jgi:SlyX protein
MIAMSELKSLGERIDLLETRLAFQDETIETLNKTITDQWLKIDALTRQLTNLNERLQEAETRAPGAANEPPPHYSRLMACRSRFSHHCAVDLRGSSATT